MAAAGNENNLWFFLRYNLWQGDIWPYYYKDDKTDEEVTGHTLEDSTRYFTIDVTGDDTWIGMADQILISMYWEIESDDPASETDKSLTVLHIRTEVTKGDCGYAMEKAYSLNVADFDSEAEEEKLEGFSNASLNPNGRQIDTNENWMWAYD
jgi:hypothetical protein